MLRDEFGSTPSYGTLSSGNASAGYNHTSRQYGGEGKFQELSEAVSSNIFQINNNTAALDRTLRQLTSGKDGLEERLHKIQVATNDLATKTAALLKEMSSLCSGTRPSVRQQRVQHERLKGEFRESISRYYSVQNKVVEKEKLLVGSTKSAKRQESSTHADDFGNDKSSLVEDDRRRQEQQQMDVQIDIDQNLIREREERLRQIEGDILDINEIFRDLANMVYDQGTLVDSIEANVDVTHGNLEGANVNLSKASSYQKKARTKMCILLIILLVVAGIIALIVILTTNH